MARGGSGNGVVCSMCFGCVFFVGAILFGCSFSTLAPTEMGIAINRASVTIDETRVYTSGRWLLGLGRGFVVFPRTLQLIEFSDSGDTADAPALRAQSGRTRITVECSLQYQLRPQDLVLLWQKHEQRYHDKLVKIAQSALKVVASEFNSTLFYTQRRTIAAAMLEEVRARLAPEFVDVRFFQLRKVTLPESVDTSVLEKLVREENTNTANNQQQTGLIEAESAVILSQAQANITELTNEKQSEANVVLNEAIAEARKIRLDSESFALTALKDGLGWSNSQLLRFFWLKSLANHKSDKVVGFEEPLVKV
eukprot:PLAT4028.1.p2 GENE.PLAT4028.1~~PLAT4028.1.p2  ORF type:complete len:329 (-),score=141.77 PLAT4028.1:135-1061(-)